MYEIFRVYERSSRVYEEYIIVYEGYMKGRVYEGYNYEIFIAYLQE